MSYIIFLYKLNVSCLVSGAVEQLVGVLALLGSAAAVLREEDALDVRRRVGEAPLSLTDTPER